jgi:hypothetical protein
MKAWKIGPLLVLALASFAVAEDKGLLSLGSGPIN